MYVCASFISSSEDRDIMCVLIDDDSVSEGIVM